MEKGRTLVLKILEYCHGGKPVSSNMVEWFGIIIYKDFSDYPDIINYIFKKYKHQLEPYIILYKLKLNNKTITNKQLHSIYYKETIDWLSDIETGGCSTRRNLKIREALNSKLKQMKLEFSSSELLDYARIKLKPIISILDLNKEFFDEFKECKIPTQQESQIIYLSKIKINSNHFPNVISYLFQGSIELLNFEGAQFILDNLNGNDLKLIEKAFKDDYYDRIYTSKYSYKDIIDIVQFLIDKFKDCQLSLSNLSLTLNYFYLKLVRVNN
ncbi:hypothetical protein ACTFIY_004052 [Dictyostelium cf. discoideum]